jgi:hypothetical protein
MIKYFGEDKYLTFLKPYIPLKSIEEKEQFLQTISKAPMETVKTVVKILNKQGA